MKCRCSWGSRCLLHWWRRSWGEVCQSRVNWKHHTRDLQCSHPSVTTSFPAPSALFRWRRRQGHKRQVKREGRKRWLPALAIASTITVAPRHTQCSSAWPSKTQNGRGLWWQWGPQHQVQMSHHEFWMEVKVMFCGTASTLLKESSTTMIPAQHGDPDLPLAPW
jgi:hypothetical protein